MSRAVSRPDAGSVTAEFAVLLPGFVLALTAVLAVGVAAAAEMRCIDAAHAAARLAARNEAPGVVLAAARSLAPAGAQVGVDRGPESVRAQVRARVTLPLPGRPGVVLSASSILTTEESVDGAASS
jgi:Flp pilus assembly protein TadG